MRWLEMNGERYHDLSIFSSQKKNFSQEQWSEILVPDSSTHGSPTIGKKLHYILPPSLSIMLLQLI
jgi:hypothetical protein